jgi:hypothetical protein
LPRKQVADRERLSRSSGARPFQPLAAATDTA